jgi:curli production assembly/transport component CsgG
MITKYKHLVVGVFLTVLSVSTSYAQDQESVDNNKIHKKIAFLNYRGTNAFDAAFGTSVINGDLPDAEFETYFKLGYKLFIADHLNINLSYNKYNIAFKDVYNEGFMSFDLNLEYLFSPYHKFSPFIQAGYGFNFANHFDTSSTKAQAAFGLEYIVTDGLGLKLFAEYNYAFTDELDGLIAGESDDTFYRIGFGLNLYFGGKKRKEKLLSQIGTVIQSNLVK